MAAESQLMEQLNSQNSTLQEEVMRFRSQINTGSVTRAKSMQALVCRLNCSSVYFDLLELSCNTRDWLGYELWSLGASGVISQYDVQYVLPFMKIHSIFLILSSWFYFVFYSTLTIETWRAMSRRLRVLSMVYRNRIVLCQRPCLVWRYPDLRQKVKRKVVQGEWQEVLIMKLT
mgnify:CR=1 FL=1